LHRGVIGHVETYQSVVHMHLTNSN